MSCISYKTANKTSEKWCENCSEQLSRNSLFPKSNLQKNSTDIKVSLGLRSCPSGKVTTDEIMGNTIKSEDFCNSALEVNILFGDL